ncbi:hypothetical protein SAMN05444123_108161 [Rhodopseudomonas pseudopalustris]|uniref:Uncharacterized protein n=1 Tax=Rhodopseudomonas pseudopalustris TaxID=1513892 RepID=A0A1H8VAX9_9BRAD|nr:hypothetical protein SAMN05444123_108161 [Rhodopseudomonas pseudopalustris]
MKKPVRKSAAPKPAKRTKLDEAAIAICQRVYAGGKCACVKGTLPVCNNMHSAAVAAGAVLAPDLTQQLVDEFHGRSKGRK